MNVVLNNSEKVIAATLVQQPNSTSGKSENIPNIIVLQVFHLLSLDMRKHRRSKATEKITLLIFFSPRLQLIPSLLCHKTCVNEFLFVFLMKSSQPYTPSTLSAWSFAQNDAVCVHEFSIFYYGQEISRKYAKWKKGSAWWKHILTEARTRKKTHTQFHQTGVE